ncbi:MAG: protein-disulfide reductase DsbD [Pseudomonadota bacterium]|jgi:thiol:disulfide interchange protein DsbD
MRKLLCLLLLFVTVQMTSLAQGGEPLLPDEAFKFKAEVVAPDKIKATWDIADGYYLYRQRFGFETETTGLKLSAPNFPQSDTKDDPNFGKLEIYHKQVVVEIPIDRGQTASQAIELALKIKYQGCAAEGICYQPLRKTANLQLAAVSPATSEASSSKAASTTLLNTIKEKNDDKSKNALPVDKAFSLTVTALNQNTLNAHWVVEPGHHLYRPKISFRIKDPAGATLGSPIFPAGKQVDDEFYGKINVFDSDFDVKVPITSTGLNKLTVETDYQGCAENSGVCYPPVTKTTELSLAGLPEGQPADSNNAQAGDQNAVVNEGDAIFTQMRDNSYFSTLMLFFLAGLGMAFTPCVFPMIPILSGIIAGYGNLSPRKAFILSLAYVLPMALTYAIVGIIAGLSGANLQVVFQTPWVIGSFAGIFILLSLSMFGFYDLQMPTSIQSRLSEISNRQQGGSFIGAGIMGVLSALIVGPCVTAPLLGALIYITQTRDAVLGGLSLFSLGLGMGLPLMMIGTSAGRLLPRAGAWMDTTKAIFGIMMLGLAIWMLDRIVPQEVTMALTGILMVVSGIYMGALDKIHEEAGGWGRFWKSIGLILLFYGAMILFGVAAGSQSLFQPLKGIFGGNAAIAQDTTQSKLIFQQVKGLNAVEAALAQAKEEQRPVMLDFYATWCVSCKELDKFTFKDPTVVAGLKNAVLIQADLSDNTDQDSALTKRFGVFGPPQVLFFAPDGKELHDIRLSGYEKADKFAKRVARFNELLAH